MVIICAIFLFSFDSSVLQYRQAYTGSNISQIQTAMDGFEDVIRRFPKCAEGYALYAQVCSDGDGYKQHVTRDCSVTLTHEIVIPCVSVLF